MSSVFSSVGSTYVSFCLRSSLSLINGKCLCLADVASHIAAVDFTNLETQQRFRHEVACGLEP